MNTPPLTFRFRPTHPTATRRLADLQRLRNVANAQGFQIAIEHTLQANVPTALLASMPSGSVPNWAPAPVGGELTVPDPISGAHGEIVQVIPAQQSPQAPGAPVNKLAAPARGVRNV